MSNGDKERKWRDVVREDRQPDYRKKKPSPEPCPPAYEESDHTTTLVDPWEKLPPPDGENYG